MPKKSSLALIMALAAVCPSALAAGGASLFQANGCAACHDATMNRIDKGLGPSLAQIADAYRQSPEALVEFLQGKAGPRLYPDKYPLMKAQLPRIMSISDTAIRSLADYLLEF